jgi:hypothetical protein
VLLLLLLESFLLSLADDGRDAESEANVVSRPRIGEMYRHNNATVMKQLNSVKARAEYTVTNCKPLPRATTILPARITVEVNLVHQQQQKTVCRYQIKQCNRLLLMAKIKYLGES